MGCPQPTMHKRLYPLSGMGCQRRHTSKSLESVTYALCPGGDTHSKRRASHWQVSFALCLKRVPPPDTNKVTGKSSSASVYCVHRFVQVTGKSLLASVGMDCQQPQTYKSLASVTSALCFLVDCPRPETEKSLANYFRPLSGMGCPKPETC